MHYYPTKLLYVLLPNTQPQQQQAKNNPCLDLLCRSSHTAKLPKEDQITPQMLLLQVPLTTVVCRMCRHCTESHEMPNHPQSTPIKWTINTEVSWTINTKVW